MNAAEAIIVTYFHRTEEHAEACLAITPHDAEIANDDTLKSVQADARWAVRMIITEEVLLQAFRETGETANLDTEGLISVAKRKIGTSGFVKEIIYYLQDIGKIPQNRIPILREIDASIRTSLAYVEKCLRRR